MLGQGDLGRPLDDSLTDGSPIASSMSCPGVRMVIEIGSSWRVSPTPRTRRELESAHRERVQRVRPLPADDLHDRHTRDVGPARVARGSVAHARSMARAGRSS